MSDQWYTSADELMAQRQPVQEQEQDEGDTSEQTTTDELVHVVGELVGELRAWQRTFGKPGTVSYSRVTLITRDAEGLVARLIAERADLITQLRAEIATLRTLLADAERRAYRHEHMPHLHLK